RSTRTPTNSRRRGTAPPRPPPRQTRPGPARSPPSTPRPPRPRSPRQTVRDSSGDLLAPIYGTAPLAYLILGGLAGCILPPLAVLLPFFSALHPLPFPTYNW